MSLSLVNHRHIDVDGVDVFYRESVPARSNAPALLLLHGFPSASHQFRRLIDALGDRYRVIAPDYPGFGNTTAPGDFVYTFDRLTDITEGFVRRLGLTSFTMYVFDFGAPIGFRLAERHPEWVAGLIVQNGNAYEAGLSDGAREFTALRPDQDGAEDTIRGLLTVEGTRSQYETGVADPTLLSPESWLLDQHFLDLPGRKEAQVALAFDYKSNIARYPAWQAWLRKHTPPTLIAWGANDPFFPEPGAHAYLADLPDAELHVFDTGHFALETHVSEIAPLIADFLDRLSARHNAPEALPKR
ncbi:alpha/beta fold hydrolase [Nocardia mexicana]|uniref:Pimeloyl-ACP methyl ester carboxylesterase n=1 Tax=Nocardia mexicana TaxID=279262 RepID=A0A370HAL2_9NOCA|nr:alpha/beta hydrolase [Nocardia mexicana]RDI53084.1 pimeloyl-ACP methyl ester carboxylesterase [Nocardia mexicana]